MYQVIIKHSVHPPPLSAGGGGGGGPLTKFLKEGLGRTSNLSGELLEEGGNFFQGGCNFYKKKKPSLKSEIFNGEKSL